MSSIGIVGSCNCSQCTFWLLFCSVRLQSEDMTKYNTANVMNPLHNPEYIREDVDASERVAYNVTNAAFKFVRLVIVGWSSNFIFLSFFISSSLYSFSCSNKFPFFSLVYTVRSALASTVYMPLLFGHFKALHTVWITYFVVRSVFIPFNFVLLPKKNALERVLLSFRRFI